MPKPLPKVRTSATCAAVDCNRQPKGSDQAVDLAGRDAVQVGLHQHCNLRLIDPSAPFYQAGENDPARSFGIRSSKSPAVVDSTPGPVAVALRQPLRDALVGGGADHGGGLGLDEGLVDGLGSLADAVVRDRKCVQDLQQCSLVKGQRALVVSRPSLAWSR
jgi:hypothetical protein